MFALISYVYIGHGHTQNTHDTFTYRQMNKALFHTVTTYLLHRSPWGCGLVEDARGVVPVGEVLGDLAKRR